MPYKDPEQARAAKRRSAARRRAKLSDEQRAAENAANAAQMAHARAVDGHQRDDVPIVGHVRDIAEGWGAATLLDGTGIAYDRARSLAEPYWWINDRAAGHGQRFGPEWWVDGCPYRGDERRWVLYALSFRRAEWDERDGRAAEARGAELWLALFSESEDVRRVAGWLRDGWRHVPHASLGYWTPERVRVATHRLLALGLLKRVGSRFLIR